MAEKADDLYLPNAVLLRIIRESLPERTLVSREARSAISKSASSFILYVTSLASVHCEKSKRKTLTGSDILAALKEMQFDHFIPALNSFLDKYREQLVFKKSNKRPHNEKDEEISTEKLSQIPSSSTSHLKHRDITLLLFVTLWIYIFYEIKQSSMIILGGEFEPVCKYKIKVSNVPFLFLLLKWTFFCGVCYSC
ncbi:TATA-binding protein-associated phosphoprotein,putative [Schistosoma mansoni]|uniref:TATA-binding protein-associated phosphoprotein,putative n=1 Tax=Schistosoma mansoni TaxID=6183 RepID=UPI00022C826B|nr:TATA-binding protein-associated phosphoprotein,putative [Schistosoma mansoni]|eukprot:XP_018646015.1 TATA-binding protein-associated phosphoprotein,putative [Schistosoma mansoni]